MARQKAKRKRGRPTAYKPEFVEQARKLCELGAIDLELADFFGVSIPTLWTWTRRYSEFLKAQKVGKEAGDNRVEKSLFQKANGYTFQSEKVFQYGGKVVRAKTLEHVPPDTVACIFWLKNRRREEWRDRSEIEHGGQGLTAIADALDRLKLKPPRNEQG